MTDTAVEAWRREGEDLADVVAHVVAYYGSVLSVTDKRRAVEALARWRDAMESL
jgi:hypothetical protein